MNPKQFNKEGFRKRVSNQWPGIIHPSTEHVANTISRHTPLRQCDVTAAVKWDMKLTIVPKLRGIMEGVYLE